MEAAASGALLLVNRVLDGDFDNDDGQALIKRLLDTGAKRVMLISNFPEAQARAEKSGALPGFGKTTMGSEETHRRLREALE